MSDHGGRPKLPTHWPATAVSRRGELARRPAAHQGGSRDELGCIARHRGRHQVGSWRLSSRLLLGVRCDGGGEAAIEVGAAAGAGRMRRCCRCIAKRAARLCKTLAVEPAAFDTLGHRPAISLELVAAHMMVAAFVMEHEEAHDLGLTAEQARIEHQHAWRSNAQIGQMWVEHVAHATATQRTPGNRQRAIALQTDRGGRLNGPTAHPHACKSQRQTRAQTPLNHSLPSLSPCSRRD